MEYEVKVTLINGKVAIKKVASKEDAARLVVLTFTTAGLMPISPIPGPEAEELHIELEDGTKIDAVPVVSH